MFFHNIEKKTKHINFFVKPSIHEKLVKLAQKDKVSMTIILEQMVERAFDEMWWESQFGQALCDEVDRQGG